jgi:hypothetical protein
MGRYGGMVNEILALVKKLKDSGKLNKILDKPKRIQPEPNEIGYT